MNREQALNGFQLHDDSVLDHDVESIPAIEKNSFVRNRKRSLSFEAKISPCELVTETGFVRGLDQPRAKMSMHLDARADHFMRAVVECRLFVDQREEFGHRSDIGRAGVALSSGMIFTGRGKIKKVPASRGWF